MDMSKVPPETAKQVKKELLKHLVKAMDDRTSGKLKKSSPPAEPEAKEDPKSKAIADKHTHEDDGCAECGMDPCECDEGGETASEEVADKSSMKARLKALVAAKKGE